MPKRRYSLHGRHYSRLRIGPRGLISPVGPIRLPSLSILQHRDGDDRRCGRAIRRPGLDGMVQGGQIHCLVERQIARTRCIGWMHVRIKQVRGRAGSDDHFRAEPAVTVEVGSAKASTANAELWTERGAEQHASVQREAPADLRLTKLGHVARLLWRQRLAEQAYH